MGPEREDRELLRAYAERGDESAFAELVARHADAVYAAARRQAGRAGLADDVTQAVFILLARKAAMLGPRVIVAGWLHRATRYVALNAVRGERRRIARELRAAAHATRPAPAADPDGAWSKGVALLDEAIARLGAKDRAAIVLRFLERRSLREVGEAIGTSEDAAQMRVARAVDKLRQFYHRRGIALSAATLGAAVETHALAAAPPAMRQSLASAALHESLNPAAGGPTARAVTLADRAARPLSMPSIRPAQVIATAAAVALIVALIWTATRPPAAHPPTVDRGAQRLPGEPPGQTEPRGREGFVPATIGYLQNGPAIGR